MPRTRRQRRGGVETSADDQEGGTDDSLVAQRLPVHLGLDQRLDDARSWVEPGLGHTLTETHHHRHRCLVNTQQTRAVGWRVHHRVRGFAINHPVRER